MKVGPPALYRCLAVAVSLVGTSQLDKAARCLATPSEPCNHRERSFTLFVIVSEVARRSTEYMWCPACGAISNDHGETWQAPSRDEEGS